MPGGNWGITRDASVIARAAMRRRTSAPGTMTAQTRVRRLRARPAAWRPAARWPRGSRCIRRPSRCCVTSSSIRAAGVEGRDCWRKLSQIVVTDDTLVQSIGELRRALGESRRAVCIVTVPRRGYRFEVAEARAPEAGARRAAGTRFEIPVACGSSRHSRSRSRCWCCGSCLSARPRPAREDGARPAIAVLPFQNRSDDAGARISRGRSDPGHHQLAGPIFRAHRHVMECGGRLQRRAGATRRHRAYSRRCATRSRAACDSRPSVCASMRNSSTSSGRVLWSAGYEEAPADVIALQDRITREVVGALAIRVTQLELQRVADKADLQFRCLRLRAARTAGASASDARRHCRSA